MIVKYESIEDTILRLLDGDKEIKYIAITKEEYREITGSIPSHYSNDEVLGDYLGVRLVGMDYHRVEELKRVGE